MDTGLADYTWSFAELFGAVWLICCCALALSNSP